ncbi:uncharacterized protein LOC108681672 [Hyalella azteca]|uniref:Uncharacterized protein LOC108681672 n=1 Tax=Hyalella azteca TaxID=294128 RepID=A0A8B7PLC9_HYAAZ|nr:uncharacterized protein LOC108681672 [Hyalella azteca]
MSSRLFTIAAFIIVGFFYLQVRAYPPKPLGFQRRNLFLEQIASNSQEPLTYVDPLGGQLPLGGRTSPSDLEVSPGSPSSISKQADLLLSFEGNNPGHESNNGGNNPGHDGPKEISLMNNYFHMGDLGLVPLDQLAVESGSHVVGDEALVDKGDIGTDLGLSPETRFRPYQKSIFYDRPGIHSVNHRNHKRGPYEPHFSLDIEYFSMDKDLSTDREDKAQSRQKDIVCPGDLLPCRCRLRGDEVHIMCEGADATELQRALLRLMGSTLLITELHLVANSLGSLPPRLFGSLQASVRFLV